MMLTHHAAHGKLKLSHLEDGGFNHQRDYKITIEDAEKLLDADIAEVNCVLHKYCHASLNISQQVALISFIFNCGSTAFKNSTLLKKLNQNKYLEAADEFLKWVYVKGKKLKGLVKRRVIERAIFLGKYTTTN